MNQNASPFASMKDNVLQRAAHKEVKSPEQQGVTGDIVSAIRAKKEELERNKNTNTEASSDKSFREAFNEATASVDPWDKNLRINTEEEKKKRNNDDDGTPDEPEKYIPVRTPGQKEETEKLEEPELDKVKNGKSLEDVIGSAQNVTKIRSEMAEQELSVENKTEEYAGPKPPWE